MDPTEQKANEFFISQGFKNIVYEPDGNVPPDFLLDGYLAVEVRRLNQNVSIGDGYKGLEEDEIPFYHRMRKLLASLGPSTTGESWFVFHHFHRPLPPWEDLKVDLRSQLLSFRNEGPHIKSDFKVGEKVTLHLLPAGSKLTHFFVPGGSGDNDAGGWVIPNLVRNLNICISEKSEKISQVRHKYPQWWLVLLDHINFAENDVLEDGLLEMEITRKDWNRIVLVDPTNPRRFHEI